MTDNSNVLKFPVLKKTSSLINESECVILPFEQPRIYPKSCPHKALKMRKMSCVKLSDEEKVTFSNKVSGLEILIQSLNKDIPHEFFLHKEYTKEIKSLKRRLKAEKKVSSNGI